MRHGLYVLFRRLFTMTSRKTTWETVKDEFLKADTETRRTSYFCGSNFVPLDSVKKWSESSVKSSDSRYPVNESLNEKISLWNGDITKLEIDAVVNAANQSLRGGGGVDGAIHRAAGKELLQECITVGGCPTGEARLTGAYRMPAKYIIHTVGPMDCSSEDLASCYNECLKLASANEIKSIAFPCISTGVYGYPNEDAAHVALELTRDFLEKDEILERIIFCVFLDKDLKIYEDLIPVYFPSN